MSILIIVYLNNFMYSISKAAQILGVSAPTLRRWEKKGKIISLRSFGNHRRYPHLLIDKFIKEEPMPKNKKELRTLLQEKKDSEIINTKKVVIYARVSSYKQAKEGNLERQITRIRQEAHLPKNTLIISEYGSGLNTDRKGLNRLLRIVEKKEVSEIYIEYKDRLTRFGYTFLERYCRYFDVKIRPISNNNKKSPAEELSEDIMALLICFSGKLYSKRRNGTNYIEDSNTENKNKEQDNIFKESLQKIHDSVWQKTIQKMLITS